MCELTGQIRINVVSHVDKCVVFLTAFVATRENYGGECDTFAKPQYCLSTTSDSLSKISWLQSEYVRIQPIQVTAILQQIQVTAILESERNIIQKTKQQQQQQLHLHHYHDNIQLYSSQPWQWKLKTNLSSLTFTSSINLALFHFLGNFLLENSATNRFYSIRNRVPNWVEILLPMNT